MMEAGGVKKGDRFTRWMGRLPIARDTPALGWLAMLAIVVIAWAARQIADPFLPIGFPYVTFFPAVIVTSFLFGIRLGVVSAILCGVIARYYFILPHHTFGVTGGAGFALAFYVAVVGIDMTCIYWMQAATSYLRQERELSQALAANRELLFRELQHRVSNNLQVAASLLTLQKRGLAEPTARAALDEAATRLALIGQISRQLYDPSGVAQPLLPFIGQICHDAIEASGRTNIDLSVSGDDALRLVPDALVAAALVVMETINNAIEHGFTNDRPGRIEVQIAREKERLCICIDNDGQPLPAGFQATQPSSLGLRIATSLAKGQGGEYRIEQRETVHTAVIFPAQSVILAAP